MFVQIQLRKRWNRGNAFAVSMLADDFTFDQPMSTILVTGGTGLVGHGIQLALERTKADGKQANEKWIFLSSKDCDLL